MRGFARKVKPTDRLARAFAIAQPLAVMIAAMAQAETRQMRLAATLTPERGAIRRVIRLAGTMRGQDDAACDIAILDVSASGFLAELPDGVALDPGMTVRVAATPIGRHRAVVVRSDGRRHGFAFARPLSAEDVAAIGPQASNVAPLLERARDDGRSWLASLALTFAAGVGFWATLALLLYLTA